jgi:hypothetical protein
LLEVRKLIVGSEWLLEQGVDTDDVLTVLPLGRPAMKVTAQSIAVSVLDGVPGSHQTSTLILRA